MASTNLGSAIWLYKRTIFGTIFLLTVPETIMRSACRGEARMISIPNRLRSKRAACTAIISIAQQASPNIMGHMERARPQL